MKIVECDLINFFINWFFWSKVCVSQIFNSIKPKPNRLLLKRRPRFMTCFVLWSSSLPIPVLILRVRRLVWVSEFDFFAWKSAINYALRTNPNNISILTTNAWRKTSVWDVNLNRMHCQVPCPFLLLLFTVHIQNRVADNASWSNSLETKAVSEKKILI